MPPSINDFLYLNEINRRRYSNKLKISNSIDGALDVNWYDEFEKLYKNNPRAVPYVERLILYDADENFYGIVGVRPINPKDPIDHRMHHSEISEMYIREPPDITEDSHCYLTCKKRYQAYGFVIDCVPYIMPNPYFGVCAHASVWICLKVLENLSDGVVESQSIPKIQRSVAGHFFSDYKGLEFHHIARLFRMNRCEAFIYDSYKMGLTDDEMKNIVYAYVESGFPVIIGIDVSKASWWDGHQPDYHSIVLIGHTMDDKTGEINGFIAHDESRFPYILVYEDELLRCWDIPDHAKENAGISKNTKIRTAVVGVPPVIGVGYEDVIKWTLLPDKWYQKGYTDIKKYMIRPMLIPFWRFISLLHSIEFKDENFYDFAYEKLQEIMEPYYPSWVWVLMLYESKKKRFKENMCGAIVIDGINGDFYFAFMDNKFIMYIKDGKLLVKSYSK